MDSYQILVYLLFTLAAIDLVVGVSNDAVNFLNSAIGSKVANIRTILIIASLGIIAGTQFSGAVMEVARKGVFNPEFFTFDKIMILFLAVMLTDILLLDFYNSIGLPTSTTVSIVFELLGAAFMTGWLMSQSMDGQVPFSQYINVESATQIIAGIFLSVLIAFTFGVLVQYLVRLVFTFDLYKSLQRGGSIFGGIAITAIVYFLFIKGAKNSEQLAGIVSYVKEYTLQILLVSFVAWTIIIQILMSAFKVNPLKVVVLTGTFSLAMAFASNDLVNFIGVAVAGLHSFEIWSVSGVGADSFSMDVLAGEIPTKSYLLYGAGIIMVVTLWLSSKARKVTETEVNLGRQSEGEERFKPNLLSRAVVGSAMAIGKVSAKVVSGDFQAKIGNRFAPLKDGKDSEQDGAAFDLLRAAVNLMGASIIIAIASNRGLPLSTTYVSFMVAMGTSLADRAWGRESAVYRVAGVLNVIGGWLMTAIIAFVASALIALILFYSGSWGAYSIAALAGLALFMSQRRFKSKERAKKEAEDLVNRQLANIEDVVASSKKETVANLKSMNDLMSMSVRALIGLNGDVLSRNLKVYDKKKLSSPRSKNKLIKYVRKMGDGRTDAGKLYLTVFDLMTELETNALTIARLCRDHVNNHHNPPSREFLDDLLEIEQRFNRIVEGVTRSVDKLDFSNSDRIADDKRALLDLLNEKLEEQVEMIQKEEITNRLGSLQTDILLELKDMVAITARVMKLYTRYAYRPVED